MSVLYGALNLKLWKEKCYANSVISIKCNNFLFQEFTLLFCVNILFWLNDSLFVYLI